VGKNAEKKKARRLAVEPDERGAPSIDDASSARGAPAPTAATTTTAQATASKTPHTEAPAWWATSMLPPVPFDEQAPDGSLARSLFRITALVGSAIARPWSVGIDGMKKVAAEVAQVVDADTVSLLRLQPGDGDLVPARLVLTASHGLHDIDAGVVSFGMNDGIAGLVARTGQVVCVDDAPRDPRFSRLYGQRTEIGSLIAVPLRVGGKILGVLSASRQEIRAFSPHDVERLHLVATTIATDLEQARLYRDAVADPLTGLVSRVALLHALPREVEIARRYQTQLSMVLIDADGLATLNATHGRSAGDSFLKTVAARLHKTVRAADLVARFGADELAVLLPMTPANQARATAKRLLRCLREPAITPATTTFTVAVATLQSQLDEDALSLIDRLDRALLTGKAQGGDTIVAAAVDRRDER
jgi:diguanylate cyclase (GGDEF)-like protein